MPYRSLIRLFTLSTVALTIAMSAPPATFAAATLRFAVTDFTDTPPAVDRSVLVVSGRDLRLDGGFRGAEQPSASTIYHGRKRSLTVLIHPTAQAMNFDRKAGSRIARHLEETRAQWEEALAKVPEAEREQARRMLEQRYPAMAQEAEKPGQAIVLRRMSNTGSTNGWDWVRWEAWDGNTKVREYLVTEADYIPGGKETVRAIADMSGYLQELTDQLGGQIPMQNPFLEISKLRGFPVVIRTYDLGAVTRETVLQTADAEPVAGSLFTNPGYAIIDPITMMGDMSP